MRELPTPWQTLELKMIKVLMIVVCVISLIQAAERKRTEIGSMAYINVIELDMDYLARIDSGARITSLHALNIHLDGKKGLISVKKPKKISGMPFYEKIQNEEFKQNIGRLIHFDTLNEKGELKHFKARVYDVAKVRNAQGIEYRYVIKLGLKYKGVVKYKEVNLRDRSQMFYKLLMGRNWLNDDFIIKTDGEIAKK